MRHLGSAAAAWDAMRRPDTELYRGGRLTTAENWRDAVRPALTSVEQGFLDASLAAEDARLEATQKQLHKERRMVRRLTWLSAGTAGFAVIALVAGLFAGYQSNLAETNAVVSEARRTAALSLEEPDLDRALLLAVEAIRLWDDPEMRVNLVRVISRAPRMVSITRIPEAGVSTSSMSLGQDGSRASVIDSDGDVRLFDLDARTQLGEYAPFANSVVTSAVDPGSGEVAFSEVAGVCADARCDFQRTGTLDLAGGGGNGVTTFEAMGRMAADVEFSADGSLFAAIAPIPASAAPANVALWRTDDEGRVAPILLDLEALGTVPAGWSGTATQLAAVKFSPDGSLLYASGFGPTFAFDTVTGQKVSQIEGDGILAVSPDGRRVAVRDGVLAVRIVDTLGEVDSTVIAVASFPDAADFSPDGRQLAVADGARVVVSDVASGATTETLPMDNGEVSAVQFRPSGDLVTATADGAIITWDVGDWSDDFRTTRSVRPLALGDEDERTIHVEQFDGQTEVVVAEPEVWEAHACEVAGHALSVQEWVELFGDRPYTPACSR
jgi:WD40 repeat protein